MSRCFSLRNCHQLALFCLLFLCGCAALQRRNRLEGLLEKFASAPSPWNLNILSPAEKGQLLDVMHEVSQLDTDQLRHFISKYQQRRCTTPEDLNFEKYPGGPWGLVESTCKLYVLILYTTNITSQTKEDHGSPGPGWVGIFDKDDDPIPAGADCPVWPIVILPSGKIDLGGRLLSYTGPPSWNFEHMFETALEKYGRRILPSDPP